MKNFKMVILFVILVQTILFAQNTWDCETYPDEAGFKKRMEPMLKRIAGQGFAKRSLAESKCPDTGLPVRVWAVEGETIVSPYTGRAYKQGPTGYFGPKARNAAGEIIAFGGDPLKKELPPTIAALLLDPENEKAKAYLSIPGNMRQQYHFACVNWTRFYPLLADEMGDAWKRRFFKWIAIYTESRRPSDGTNREWLPLSEPHNLIGEPEELLGGNTKDGGTENHKTMWRTSGLLYSQLLPDTCLISGVPVQKAEVLTKAMIRKYFQRILQTGNGEYDSQVYYPYSIKGFLNLYDFSPDEETRQLAKAILDYYLVTYGLKVIDGTIAGPQKRGYLAGAKPSMMEILQWGFFDHVSRNMSDVATTIQQATTTYRPNQIIWDIVRKEVELPFEAKMSRPFYHMDRPHAFAETYYCSQSYAMGNVQMTIVDNPNQQMVWSLVAKGKEGPLCFSGGHPMRASTSGHSPYTQTLQSKGSLIVLTAPTKILTDADTLIAPTYSKIKRPNLWHLPNSEQGESYEIRNRQKYGRNPLEPVKFLKSESAKAYEDFYMDNRGSACTWFFYPRKLKPVEMNDLWIFEANQTWVAVIPLTKESYVIQPPMNQLKKIQGSAGKFFKDYSLLVFPGEISGYVVETGERSKYKSVKSFVKAIQKKSKLETIRLESDLRLSYQSIQGSLLEMKYRPEGLRCEARIDGMVQDWDNFTEGAVYESPYVRVKEGKMEVSNGKEGYVFQFDDNNAIWKSLE